MKTKTARVMTPEHNHTNEMKYKMNMRREDIWSPDMLFQATRTKPMAPADCVPHDMDLLNQVFHMQNPSRNRACNDHAIKLIRTLCPDSCTMVQKGGNLLVRKGKAKGPHPFYLAHMDQVHDYVPFMKVKTHNGMLYAVDGNDEQCGVGGDDKCGIYLALMMLHLLDHVTCVFVRDEEVGCEGSGVVPLGWFDHAAFVIQADRNNGTMDIIAETNGMICASDDFIDQVLDLPVVHSAGHCEAQGSITDIGELASRGLAVSMINISSGYHNPHSRREVVNLEELAIAVQLGLEAGRLMGGAKWKHTPESYWRTSKSSQTSWGKTSSPSVPGDDWSDDATWEELTEDNDLALAREHMIQLLVSYGYDREHNTLDDLTLSELCTMAEEYEEWEELDTTEMKKIN